MFKVWKTNTPRAKELVRFTEGNGTSKFVHLFRPFFLLPLETCWTEITLFSPEVRLDMIVVSGAWRCTQDPRSRGASQEKAAASFCEEIRAPARPPLSASTLQAHSGIPSVKKTHHPNFLAAPLSEWKVIMGSTPRHTRLTRGCQEADALPWLILSWLSVPCAH